jgi:ribosomal protein L19E
LAAPIKKVMGNKAMIRIFKTRDILMARRAQRLINNDAVKNKDNPKIIKSMIKTGHDPSSTDGREKGKGQIFKLNPTVGLMSFRSFPIEPMSNRASPK